MTTDPQPTPPAPAETVSLDYALTSAARLLHVAEMETNLAVMERIEKLADSWISIANTLLARERG